MIKITNYKLLKNYLFNKYMIHLFIILVLSKKTYN